MTFEANLTWKTYRKHLSTKSRENMKINVISIYIHDKTLGNNLKLLTNFWL